MRVKRMDVFTRRESRRESKVEKKKKKNVFFHGVQPRKNTVLHPSLAGGGESVN